MDLAVGLRGTATVRVTEALTATALGSGDVPVYGTPAMVALLEAAALDALRGHLGPDETTVGTRLDVAHLAATPVGAAVRAEATLTAVEGRTLTFAVVAFDAQEKIGEGAHHRAVISRPRFLARLAAKS
jgi:fluoroacetyl-CoA thioesterase